MEANGVVVWDPAPEEEQKPPPTQAAPDIIPVPSFSEVTPEEVAAWDAPSPELVGLTQTKKEAIHKLLARHLDALAAFPEEDLRSALGGDLEHVFDGDDELLEDFLGAVGSAAGAAYTPAADLDVEYLGP